MKWVKSKDEGVKAWFGSYARRTATAASKHIDIVPGNHVILVGDPKQPTPKFYGGGYPINDHKAVELHNLNRLLRGSTDRKPLPSAHVARFALLFMSRQNRDSFIGDLEERHGILFQKLGRRAATRWFWREVIRSFFSLAFDALRRNSGLEKLMRRIGS